MKINILALLVIVAMSCAIFLGLYWINMSKAEKWLLFNHGVAAQYSELLLSGQLTSKVPDNIIDMHISCAARVVTYDSNDQNNFFALAYSPDGIPNPSQSFGQSVAWKKMKGNWYELEFQ